MCNLCYSGVMGDEYHFLFECQNADLLELRRRLIPTHYRINPNTYKFRALLNSDDKGLQMKVAKYVYGGFQLLA